MNAWRCMGGPLHGQEGPQQAEVLYTFTVPGVPEYVALGLAMRGAPVPPDTVYRLVQVQGRAWSMEPKTYAPGVPREPMPADRHTRLWVADSISDADVARRLVDMLLDQLRLQGGGR